MSIAAESVEVDTNPFRYCGEEYDAGLNQLNLRARWYTPALGRFTSEDPAKDGTNWYAYCSNDPVNYADPTGLEMAGDKETYGENSVVYRMLVDLGDAWNNATDSNTRDRIHAMAEKLRTYDVNSINKVMILNDIDGAGGFGHTGILLINANGEGLFFSYYPETFGPSVPGEMRFKVMDNSEVNDLLYGSGNVNAAIANNGNIRNEQYERSIYNDISTISGYNMFSQAQKIFRDPGLYQIWGYQCDNVAAKILNYGGLPYKVSTNPNRSFVVFSETYDKPVYDRRTKESKVLHSSF